MPGSPNTSSNALAVGVDVYAMGKNAFQARLLLPTVGYYENGRFIRCTKVGREYRPNPRMKRLK